MKKNITQLNSQQVLSQALALQGVSFEWNDTITGNDRPDGMQYGFTAQNIQDVFPGLVSKDNQGYLQTAYGTYDAMYVEAIRALKKENQLLKQQNETQQSEISMLKTEVSNIQEWQAQYAKMMLILSESNKDGVSSESEAPHIQN